MKRLIFIVCVMVSNYVVAMRYARPSTRPVARAASQRCIILGQRSYAILRPGKYYSRLVYCPSFEKEYFSLPHLEHGTPLFSIKASLLQHIMVDQKTRLADPRNNFYEQAFKVLHKIVQEKSKYDYSNAYNYQQKLSLYLLLKYVRWDGTIEESEDYPDNLKFPVLLNEKEVVLSVNAMYDCRKSRDIGLDAFYLSGDCENDSEHHAKIMKEYALLFEGKL